MCISSLVKKESQNMTVVNEVRQLGTNYRDFLHHLTLVALVFVKASEIQGTEAHHAKDMAQATTHIFQSLSKATSTTLLVVNVSWEFAPWHILGYVRISKDIKRY